MRLTIHESIGHPTELDRVIGEEANDAGTSFVAPPEKMIGTLKYGTPLTKLDDESPGRTVELAARLARLAPEDPELMAELGPRTIQSVSSFVEATADLDAETRARAVKRAVDSAAAAGTPAGEVFSAGFLGANARATASCLVEPPVSESWCVSSSR